MALFIVFEGIEGCGKTTQAKRLFNYLTAQGFKTHLTKEPGGTDLGMKIRDLLLSHHTETLPPIAELLLYEADRSIHIHNVIKPFLHKDYIVISDRFYYSTIAYQHFGRGLSYDLITLLNTATTESLKPDITFLLDIPVEEAFKRLNRQRDRIESESISFHQKVREGFLTIAKQDKNIVIIDATQSPDDVFNQVLQALTPLLHKI
ncbi:MAG: dTMP kinase [Fervidobacterium sp.]|jgi:dTMP kinase